MSFYFTFAWLVLPPKDPQAVRCSFWRFFIIGIADFAIGSCDEQMIYMETLSNQFECQAITSRDLRKRFSDLR